MRRIQALSLLLVCSSAAAAELPGVVKTDHFYDVALVGEQLWIVGFPGHVLHSGDGGKTFESQGPGGREALFAVDFVDERTGFAAGRGGLVLGTSDGGKHWERQPTGTTEPLLALDFADANLGMAVGNFATVLRTTDGGKSWTKIAVASEGEDPCLNGVAFLPDKKGVVIVGEFGKAWVSEDAGEHFTAVDTGAGDSLFGVAATASGAIVAVGAGGAIVTSADRGKTFQAATSGTSKRLFRVAESGGRLLVAGTAGILLSSENPSGPWNSTKLPTHLWVSSARFGGSGRIVAVGARALVLTSSDGGKTFAPLGGAK